MSHLPSTTLPEEFFLRPAEVVARGLLGKILTGPSGQGRIVEVEAYGGSDDPASHAYRGPTKRSEIMFRSGGVLYVYFIYGMYWCANVVTGEAGVGSAVLIRALAPLGDLQPMFAVPAARPKPPSSWPAGRANCARRWALTAVTTASVPAAGRPPGAAGRVGRMPAPGRRHDPLVPAYRHPPGRTPPLEILHRRQPAHFALIVRKYRKERRIRPNPRRAAGRVVSPAGFRQDSSDAVEYLQVGRRWEPCVMIRSRITFVCGVLLLPALVGCELLLATVKGSGTVVTKSRQLDDFDTISISGTFTVRIINGQPGSVAVTTDDNLIPFVKVHATGGMLELSMEPGSYKPSDEIRIRVTAPSIHSLDVAGASEVSQEAIDEKDVTVDVSGASRLTLEGRCDSLDVSVSGASRLNARELSAKIADVDISGASRATILASESIAGDVSGASKLVHRGTPDSLEVETSGASKVAAE